MYLAQTMAESLLWSGSVTEACAAGLGCAKCYETTTLSSCYPTALLVQECVSPHKGSKVLPPEHSLLPDGHDLRQDCKELASADWNMYAGLDVGRLPAADGSRPQPRKYGACSMPRSRLCDSREALPSRCDKKSNDANHAVGHVSFPPASSSGRSWLPNLWSICSTADSFDTRPPRTLRHFKLGESAPQARRSCGAGA